MTPYDFGRETGRLQAQIHDEITEERIAHIADILGIVEKAEFAEGYRNGFIAWRKEWEEHPWLPSAAELDVIEDNLLRGYEGCYHKDSESCDCAAKAATHQAWIESDSTIHEPEWLPSAAELDESLQAGKEMIEDETRAFKAQPINGAYYL
jgi:hypothetical protein